MERNLRCMRRRLLLKEAWKQRWRCLQRKDYSWDLTSRNDFCLRQSSLHQTRWTNLFRDSQSWPCYRELSKKLFSMLSLHKRKQYCLHTEFRRVSHHRNICCLRRHNPFLYRQRLLSNRRRLRWKIWQQDPHCIFKAEDSSKRRRVRSRD